MTNPTIYLPSDCLSSGVMCPCKKDIGHTVFHVLANALGVARWHNRNAGDKVVKIVVLDRHFEIVPVDA